MVEKNCKLKFNKNKMAEGWFATKCGWAMANSLNWGHQQRRILNVIMFANLNVIDNYVENKELKEEEKQVNLKSGLATIESII